MSRRVPPNTQTGCRRRADRGRTACRDPGPRPARDAPKGAALAVPRRHGKLASGEGGQREFRADGRGPRDEPSRVPLPLLWPRPSCGPRAEMADCVCTRRGPRAAQWTRALRGHPALPFILPFPDLVPDVSHSASPIVRPGLQPPHHPRHINRAGPDIVVPPDPHRTETGTAAICAGAMQNTARGWDACTKDHLDLIDHSTFRTEDLRDTAESPADPGMPLACGPGI